MIVQVPKITAIKENVFSTYYDGWNDEAHYPKRGCFEIQEFINSMKQMGFELKRTESKKLMKGFFNRCSFERHKVSMPDEDNALDFFQSWTAEFVYGNQ